MAGLFARETVRRPCWVLVGRRICGGSCGGWRDKRHGLHSIRAWRRANHAFLPPLPNNIRSSPKRVAAPLFVVRLKGVLTAAEEHPVKSLPGEKGRICAKRVRSRLIETALPTMEAMV